jgi:hypothetical protein
MIFEGRHLVIPTRGHIIRLASDRTLAWELASPLRSPPITWNEDAAMLFESCGGGGVAIIDPERGQRKHLISVPGAQVLDAATVERGRLYVTTSHGEMLAFRSPA